MVTPALDSVFRMMDIGLSASLWPLPFAWKAARIFAVRSSLVLVELAAVELVPVELLLELSEELVLDVEAGGGGGGPPGPPRACARS
jgi:hypothetical protein